MTIASNVLRFQQNAPTRRSYPSVRTSTGGEQFCFLEDLHPSAARAPAVAISVPMQEIHGAAFRTLLESTRALAIVDLRMFPTFTLTASTGSVTRERIRRCGASYLNLPVDFVHIDTKAAEWEVLSKVVGVVKQLKEAVGPLHAECLFLLNRHADRALFERSLVAAGETTGNSWRIMELGDIGGLA